MTTAKGPITIDGLEAWKSVLASSTSRWVADRKAKHWPRCGAARLERGVIVPEVHPGFTLSKADRIFTMGSCFAREVENFLVARGYRVATREADGSGLLLPPHLAAGVLNKFTTHSMLNELRWAAGIQAFPEASFVEEQEGRWVDLQVIPEIPPAPRTEVASRRGALRDLFGAAFDCRVILLTLGLVEAWFDEETGVFLNRAPGFWTVKRNPGRFTFHVLDGASNREALEEIRGLLLARDGDRRFVVTVSPVPLSETFSGNDVLVANTYSKATLRTVAGDFARAHPDVDYFPSYEIASLSDRRVAFQEDLHHVHPAVVDVIVSTFLKCYGEAEAAPPDPDQVTQQRLASLEGSLLAENAALRAEVSHLRGELINREESGVGPIADGLTLSPSGVIRDRDGRFLVASEHLDGTAEIGCLAEGEVLVTGWAADRRPVAGPVAVVVFRDAALVAMILPTIRRPDVGAALGLDSPDCGFEMRFPVPATSGVFRVYCVSSGGEARELNYLCSFSLPSEGDGPVLAAGEPKHREGILHQT